MSAPVDVLAVLEREAQVANAYRRESGANVLASDAAQEAEEARAAMAELIAAASGIEGLARLADAPLKDYRAAVDRLTAALARVGGAV
ncbi:hypothetical protein [Xanthomonas axonopodis]|uniref:hypothetical protein n=1 Tax=Xanthomonas axonopodis TaxID=53413 RepID=UPI0035561877